MYNGAMPRVIALLLVLGVTCVGAASRPAMLAFLPVAVDGTPDQVQSAAERIVELFAVATAAILDVDVTPPTIEIRSTPNLAYFDHRSWTIVLAHWPVLDPSLQAFFLELTDSPEDAAALFGVLFNEFLVAHEMAHWLQRTLGLERDRYTSEREANDIAVALFLAVEDGEARLVDLRPRLAAALARLPDPTPRGVDEAQFFNDHYAELARNPYAYGYYQFRFILESIDCSAELDFESLLRAVAAE